MPFTETDASALLSIRATRRLQRSDVVRGALEGARSLGASGSCRRLAVLRSPSLIFPDAKKPGPRPGSCGCIFREAKRRSLSRRRLCGGDIVDPRRNARGILSAPPRESGRGASKPVPSVAEPDGNARLAGIRIIAGRGVVGAAAIVDWAPVVARSVAVIGWGVPPVACHVIS